MSIGELARSFRPVEADAVQDRAGRGHATVETLALLGTALDVPARRFLTERGTPVYVQRHEEWEWTDSGAWLERVLDETHGSGYVRTLVVRLHRVPKAVAVSPHAVSTLHHLYVISGKPRTGPVSEPVDLAGGDFVRFRGDVEHRYVCLTERVVVHLVTTLPRVRQFGPTVLRPRLEANR
jgi:quercetin dioxygenase-like cupin family protein